MMNKFPLLLLIVGLVSCTGSHKPLLPLKFDSSEQAIVYIYRPESMANIFISPVLMIDGIEKFPVKNDRYSYIQLPPGKYELQLKLDDRYQGVKNLALAVESGGRYFVKVESGLKFKKHKAYERAFSLFHIQHEIAASEIRQCGYMEAKMASKYLWSNKSSSKDLGASDTEQNDVAFDILKSRDPFSRPK